ncbi:MAG: SMC-Scp complex subunit ScpB [Candidatus Marinimicrobia bacterium]|nr:SMC-Scp complex subunit ScpB [Candidatus Neomarinimicrobiota bacterium]
MLIDEQVQIVEALLFASEKPLTESRVRSILETDEPLNLEAIVEELNQHYTDTDRAFFIMRVAGGYQLVTHKQFEPYIKKLYVSSSRMRLSQAALETLSIIAYKQPISRPDVDSIRGVNSDGVIRTLLERDLLVITGREDQPGRPLLYGTSEEFLRYFGLNSLDDLPKLREIDKMMAEGDHDELPDDLTQEELEMIEQAQAEDSETE